MDFSSKKNLFSRVKQAKLNKCVHCLVGKHKKVFFSEHSSSRKLYFLELVHSHLCGSCKESIGDALYFVNFIDDHSCNLCVFFLKP